MQLYRDWYDIFTRRTALIDNGVKRASDGRYMPCIKKCPWDGCCGNLLHTTYECFNIIIRILSQRDLAHKLQLAGYDMDKNVITRIETNKRYVTDIELRTLSKVLDVSYMFLIDGKDE